MAGSRRLGPAVFDPNGELIPAQARNTTFLQVLQYQTLDALNTDYNALEVALEKRYSNRWSGRVSYTLAKANDVGAITFDTNPRGDYGRTSFDNRHAFAMTANTEIWKGLGGRGDLPLLLGLPDQRDHRLRRQRRHGQQRSTARRRERSDHADSLRARFQRPCDSQRHRRREAGPARRPFPVRLEDPALCGPACSSRSTT